MLDGGVTSRFLPRAQDPPHDAQITVTGLVYGDGYMWRKYEDWVYAALDKASSQYFGTVCWVYGKRSVPRFTLVHGGDEWWGSMQGGGKRE